MTKGKRYRWEVTYRWRGITKVLAGICGGVALSGVGILILDPENLTGIFLLVAGGISAYALMLAWDYLPRLLRTEIWEKKEDKRYRWRSRTKVLAGACGGVFVSGLVISILQSSNPAASYLIGAGFVAFGALMGIGDSFPQLFKEETEEEEKIYRWRTGAKALACLCGGLLLFGGMPSIFMENGDTISKVLYLAFLALGVILVFAVKDPPNLLMEEIKDPSAATSKAEAHTPTEERPHPRATAAENIPSPGSRRQEQR